MQRIGFSPDTWDFPYPSRRMPLLADNAVATSQPLAVQAGLRLLAAGGNAVDAALGAAIALTVVEPTSNGVGGDLFAQVWDGGTLWGLNASGRSPAAWTPERFAGRAAMPETGWDTVTVPGAVDGWARLSERFGRLPFADLFLPAIEYARQGFCVAPVTAERWAQAAGELRGYRGFANTFLPGGRPPRAGERFRCPDLARTLQRIADSGGEDFYRGELARRIAAASQADGGALTEGDLDDHRSEWVSPLGVDYRGVRLHELPPNGQGLAALIALGILERFDLGRLEPDSPDALHLQIEAMKCAFDVVFDELADPGWMRRPPSRYLSPEAFDRMAESIRPQAAAPPGRARLERGGTVYLCAADAGGWMVSLIQSNYLGFGSGIVVPGTGISLHNRGRGFVLAAGHPNCVAGGKRPYHTIIPGFVTRRGRPLMSFGVMGGHMQPQGHVQVMVRIFDWDQNPQAACDAPRWLVGEDFSVALEAGFPQAAGRELARRGHRLVPAPHVSQFGGAQIVYRLESGYCAASDPRKEGQAAGF